MQMNVKRNFSVHFLYFSPVYDDMFYFYKPRGECSRSLSRLKAMERWAHLRLQGQPAPPLTRLRPAPQRSEGRHPPETHPAPGWLGLSKVSSFSSLGPHSLPTNGEGVRHNSHNPNSKTL